MMRWDHSSSSQSNFRQKKWEKLAFDARSLNLVKHAIKSSWPLELVEMIMTRVKGKFFSIGDLSCTYHQIPLEPDLQRPLNF